MTWVMIGIVILVILAIGAYSVGIPMLSGTAPRKKVGILQVLPPQAPQYLEKARKAPFP